MRGRIRTIKPEAFTDEKLWDLEVETGLPVFRGFVGLWTIADREGRFEWRPRPLKAHVLPYWDGDFSRVLDALVTRGFVLKYACGTREYGVVTHFTRHQTVNNREEESKLPAPPGAPADSTAESDTLTRAARVPDACGTPLVRARGERKGTEGKGREGSVASSTRNEDLLARSRSVVFAAYSDRYTKRMATPVPPQHFETLRTELVPWIAEYCRQHDADPEAVALAVMDGFFARTDMKRPKAEWLCEDPARYLGLEAKTTDKRAETRDRLEAEDRERWKRTELEAVPPPPEAVAALNAFARNFGSVPKSPDVAARKALLEAQANQLRAAKEAAE